MSDSPIQPTPTQASVTAEVKSKKGSSRGIIIGCCLAILILLCICCSATLLIFGGTLSALNNEYSKVQPIFSSICKASSLNSGDLSRIYNNNTTLEFRAATTLSEFTDFIEQYNEYLSNCGVFNSANIDFLSVIQSGNAINYSVENGSETFTLRNQVNDANVTLVLQKEGGEWKIHNLSVRPI